MDQQYCNIEMQKHTSDAEYGATVHARIREHTHTYTHKSTHTY